jgi:hypothetical protein
MLEKDLLLLYFDSNDGRLIKLFAHKKTFICFVTIFEHRLGNQDEERKIIDTYIRKIGN